MKQAERPGLRRWTRHEYARLISHGFLDEDDPIELLDGLLPIRDRSGRARPPDRGDGQRDFRAGPDENDSARLPHGGNLAGQQPLEPAREGHRAWSKVVKTHALKQGMMQELLNGRMRLV